MESSLTWNSKRNIFAPNRLSGSLVQLILFLGVKRQEREAGHSHLVRSLNFTRLTYLGMELTSCISYLTRILVSACSSLRHIIAEVCCQKFNYSFACSIFNCQFHINLISRTEKKKPSERFLCSLWQGLTALGHYFHVLNLVTLSAEPTPANFLYKVKLWQNKKGKGMLLFLTANFVLTTFNQ